MWNQGLFGVGWEFGIGVGHKLNYEQLGPRVLICRRKTKMRQTQKWDRTEISETTKKKRLSFQFFKISLYIFIIFQLILLQTEIELQITF